MRKLNHLNNAVIYFAVEQVTIINSHPITDAANTFICAVMYEKNSVNLSLLG